MKNQTTQAARETKELNLDLDLSNTVEESSIAQVQKDATNLVASEIPPPTTGSVVLLDPDSIAVGVMPNRQPQSYTGPAFEELLSSIESQRGNMQPIHVYQLDKKSSIEHSGAKYMLIAGARRRHACAEAGFLVRAIVVEDQISGGYMLDTMTENLHREDLSPYEFGCQVRYTLREGGAPTLSRLAKKLGKDKSILSRAKDLAELPSAILDIIPNKRELRYSDAKPLTDAISGDGRDSALAEAETIAQEIKSGAKSKTSDVVKRIVAASKGMLVEQGHADNSAAADQLKIAPMRCGDEVVGDTRVDKFGHLSINVSVALSESHHAAIVKQVQAFIAKRVLKIKSPKTASDVVDGGGGPKGTEALTAGETEKPNQASSQAEMTLSERVLHDATVN